MAKSDRRLFDLGLILLCTMAIVAILDLSILPDLALRVAMTLIIWLICSLPVAVLIGHCALSEE